MPSTDDIYADSVAGQVIERARQRGRLAHAIVLQGAEPAALETFARHTAARLLELPRSWAAGTSGHADLITLRPSGKLRQIRIGTDSAEPNSMRAFVRQLAQSPLSAQRKVGVVFEAERLNPSSANAFLKTLEEPPLDTTILLLTERPYSLLPTIRSRCLSFRIPARAGTTSDLEWSAWLDDYRNWLCGLRSTGTDKTAAAGQVMMVYGLVSRFAKWMETATSRALEHLKQGGALENLDDDEVDALKTSTSVGVRQRFLCALETATCEVARESSTSAGTLAVSVRELERAAGLLRVNFNENSALELFLLSTLRAWSRREG